MNKREQSRSRWSNEGFREFHFYWVLKPTNGKNTSPPVLNLRERQISHLPPTLYNYLLVGLSEWPRSGSFVWVYNVPPENYFLAFFWSIKTEGHKAITPDNWVFPHKHAIFCQMKLLLKFLRYGNTLTKMVPLSPPPRCLFCVTVNMLSPAPRAPLAPQHNPEGRRGS